MTEGRLAALRQTIAAIELEGVRRPQPLSFGLSLLDERLGGGLASGALHEIYAAKPSDVATATGFVAALAVRSRPGPILWVRQSFSVQEGGGLYGPGLADLGLDPARVICIDLSRPADLLRAAHDGLTCAVLSAVVVEPWGQAKVFDLTALRKLALTARSSGVPAFCLRLAAEPAPSPALTRWVVRAVPSKGDSRLGPGAMSFEARLVLNRRGQSDVWLLEWESDGCVFRHLSSLPQSALSASVDAAPARLSAARRHVG